MNRALIATATGAVLIALALPAAALDEDATAPCEAPEEGVLVLGTGAFEPVEFSAPALPNAPFHDVDSTVAPLVEEETGQDVPAAGTPEGSYVDMPVLVDASGDAKNPTGDTASTTFSVAWDGDAGDFDLYVLDAEGNELGAGTSFNPLDGPGETAAANAAHCQLLTLRLENYAGVPGTALTLTGKITRVR